ncbi:hypothetical protein ACVWXM_009603 [Bradyrhizobium sp. GM7.3]
MLSELPLWSAATAALVDADTLSAAAFEPAVKVPRAAWSWTGGYVSRAYGRRSFSDHYRPSIYRDVADSPAFLAGEQIGYSCQRDSRVHGAAVLLVAFAVRDSAIATMLCCLDADETWSFDRRFNRRPDFAMLIIDRGREQAGAIELVVHSVASWIAELPRGALLRCDPVAPQSSVGLRSIKSKTRIGTTARLYTQASSSSWTGRSPQDGACQHVGPQVSLSGTLVCISASENVVDSGAQ